MSWFSCTYPGWIYARIWNINSLSVGGVITTTSSSPQKRKLEEKHYIVQYFLLLKYLRKTTYCWKKIFLNSYQQPSAGDPRLPTRRQAGDMAWQTLLFLCLGGIKHCNAEVSGKNSFTSCLGIPVSIWSGTYAEIICEPCKDFRIILVGRKKWN